LLFYDDGIIQSIIVDGITVKKVGSEDNQLPDSKAEAQWHHNSKNHHFLLVLPFDQNAKKQLSFALQT